MSYSRDQVGLVADLVPQLHRAGLDAWVDFEALEPGQAWEPQILKAIETAEVVLVVVSRAAMRSPHVVQEWRHALACGVPLVLAVAQAASLPSELEARPWCDLRRGTRRQMGEVRQALLAPLLADRAPRSPPTRGFRAPGSVWWALITSAPVGVCALCSFWTILLPLVLAPLPVQVVRRSFSYVSVRNALMALPLAQIGWIFAWLRGPGEWAESERLAPILACVAVTSIVTPLPLYLAIRSRSFRRWVGPAARRPDRRRQTAIDATPRPICYAIDCADQDSRYAEAVRGALSRCGHREVDRRSAELTLGIISRFHHPAGSSGRGGMIPILVSEPVGTLPESVARVQWVDLRRGADPRALNALAMHLDHPKEFLASVGSLPATGAGILPRGVAGLFNSLLVAAAVSIGAWLLLAIGTRGAFDELHARALWLSAAMTAAAVVTSLLLARAVRRRTLRALGVWVTVVLLSMAGTGIFMELARPDGLLTVQDEGLSRGRDVLVLPCALVMWFVTRHRPAHMRWSVSTMSRRAE